MNKHGYSIIFFIGYLFGATCIVALGFEWLITLNNTYKSFTKKHRITILAKLAHDSLMRDIHTAPSEHDKWIHQGPDELAWKTITGELVSWTASNNELIRSQKKIQKNNKKTHTISKSIIANQVDYFRGVTVKSTDGTIVGVMFSYSIGTVELKNNFIRTGVNA